MEILKLVIKNQIVNDKNIQYVFKNEIIEFIDGSKSLEILKDLEFFRKIKPIVKVCLTSYIDQESKKFITKRGDNFVLDKPCSSYSLEHILREIFKFK